MPPRKLHIWSISLFLNCVRLPRAPVRFSETVKVNHVRGEFSCWTGTSALLRVFTDGSAPQRRACTCFRLLGHISAHILAYLSAFLRIFLHFHVNLGANLFQCVIICDWNGSRNDFRSAGSWLEFLFFSLRLILETWSMNFTAGLGLHFVCVCVCWDISENNEADLGVFDLLQMCWLR